MLLAFLRLLVSLCLLCKVSMHLLRVNCEDVYRLGRLQYRPSGYRVLEVSSLESISMLGH